MGYLVSIVILSVLIFFHELGHYLVARLNGVYVEVFSIGFGKRLFSFRAFDTTWQISAIPVGGYVKMKGQDDTNPTKRSYDKDSYNTKTPLQRISILLAGPFANFVLAYLFFFFIALGGPNVLEPVIGSVVENSPAQLAGLKPKDKILEINSQKVKTWNEMAQIIATSKGELNLKIYRNGYIEFKTLKPTLLESKDQFGKPIKRRMIGISASKDGFVKLDLGLLESFKYAWDKTVWSSMLIFDGLKKLITGEVPAKELGGVVSIVKVTADAADAGWMAVFFFAALISVNLGVLNLLPIPALDGGHIMFNLYELLTKKEPSEAVLVKLTIAGWVILFGLMGLGLYNDINRLMG